MNIETAYRYLYQGALIWFGILIFLMLIRSVIGPRLTDRILSINMIGTMVSCCICILSVLLDESYLIDVALLYSMISFLAVLILSATYIPRKPGREKYGSAVRREILEERKHMQTLERLLAEKDGTEPFSEKEDETV